MDPNQTEQYFLMSGPPDDRLYRFNEDGTPSASLESVMQILSSYGDLKADAEATVREFIADKGCLSTGHLGTVLPQHLDVSPEGGRTDMPTRNLWLTREGHPPAREEDELPRTLRPR